MDSPKLLVVDDEADFANFVADVAEGMDFEVLLTNDPSEFSTIYSADIDIVVLDLFMPDIDGIELLRFLTANKSQASIVFMTGKDMGVLRSAQQLALEQGMTVLGALQKPFLARELEDLLAKHGPRPTVRVSSSDALPTLDELRAAIRNNELFLAYQPQIKLADRNVVGVEALIRWRHPVKGMIPPDYFIPVAEQNELIADITSFATDAAIRQQGEWRKKGVNLRMSINISPKILDDLDIPEKLAARAAQTGANIPDIVIEVTETALMSDVTRYMDILARLRMKGFNLSIDDFGTGYSSLLQLVRVPFTELKIDLNFVRNLETDAECKTITEISILLAHKLGMHVVAEGIENEAVWNILSDLGCDQGQGYWMGRPMPAGEIEQWMSNWASA